MSILTRVFVVLLSVLSVALSAFVLATFAQQENWRASAKDWRSAALAAQAKERAASSNAALEQQRSLARRSQDQQTIGDLQARLQTKETESAELERKLAEAQNGLTVEQAQVTSANENSKVVLAALNHEKEFSTKLASRNSELERRNVDLNDRVQDMTTSLTMARSMVRALKQQIESMAKGPSADSQIPGGSAIVEANTPTVEPSVGAISSMATPIRAEITSIRGDLASISVGSADGVAPGMRFLVYRSGGSGGKPEYLGTLKVTRVDANQSAGEIELSEGEIRAGDSVRDEASFALRQ